jgi:hypothetical protein
MKLRRIPPSEYFDRVRFQLLEDEVVNGHKIPKGFITDGLSLPFFIRTFYSPLGRGFRAAVLHDYLLNKKTLPRSMCADAFLAAMKASGVAFAVRRTFYCAVKANDFVMH